MPGDVTTFVYGEEPPVPAVRFSHDREKRLLILTWSDGRIETFRDNPARQLVVELDPETGEPRPVTKKRSAGVCLFVPGGTREGVIDRGRPGHVRSAQGLRPRRLARPTGLPRHRWPRTSGHRLS